MKIKSIKIQIVSLAVFVVLGSSSFINNHPVLLATNNQMASDYVFTRNFHHSPVPVLGILQPQGTTTNTSLPADTQESQNWAGYIDTPSSSNSYTSVSGSWTVPNISASQQNAMAAQWIGLGGSLTTDLLQMGTIEQLKNGQPIAEVFWEQLPSTAQNVMTVPIGSTIKASISQSAVSSSTWNLTFTVNGQSQTQTISPVTLDSSYVQGIGTSAEWISEDPSNQNGQPFPLANMGSVSYQYATVNGQPLNSAGNQVQPFAMVSNNGDVLIVPSTLGTDGESFYTNVPSSNTNTNSTLGNGQNGNPSLPSNWGQDGISITFVGIDGGNWTIQLPPTPFNPSF
ncbi:Peptidase A4 family [Candidatus Desulfosporosinus infrequens]|uniref:Peptidase A4 family n=1 Tax=Candidatus Desulfosporosinus infrequens TaxID=2043169 RepID=A0A2U3LNH4_9FIRM|nr:Peptidase A4 family [Candidatus Desulfosporosinus infrequens]